MESKPPYNPSECEACQHFSTNTYDVVVGATDGVGGAAIARTNTNDVDGRALEADEASDVSEDDAEEPEQDVRRSGVRLYKERVSVVKTRF